MKHFLGIALAYLVVAATAANGKCVKSFVQASPLAQSINLPFQLQTQGRYWAIGRKHEHTVNFIMQMFLDAYHPPQRVRTTESQNLQIKFSLYFLYTRVHTAIEIASY